MARRRYSLSIEPTDPRPGWKLGARVVPRGLTIKVKRYFRFSDDWQRRTDLADAEFEALAVEDFEKIGIRDWLELDVVSSPTEPPRCVALRAPAGISTPEQRFPLAGIVTEAVAAIASKDGSYVDYAHDLEYEDTLFEASRVRGRKRPRRAVTPERLDEVERVASENPRTPTAAVQRHFGVSRGYAIKLRKLADSR